MSERALGHVYLLELCPFCGGGNIDLGHVKEVGWYGFCNKCKASGPIHAEKTKAAKAWNTRQCEYCIKEKRWKATL